MKGPSLSVSSTAFADGDSMSAIHATHAAGGSNVSPPLSWSGAPAGTMSYALECVDFAPIANRWVHWLVVDIPAETTSLVAGASRARMPAGARELANGYGTTGWGGPQPPPGSGLHEYRITIHALNTARVEVADDATLDEFHAALRAHALASGSLSGTFQR